MARSGSSRDNMRDPSGIDGQLFKVNMLCVDLDYIENIQKMGWS